MSSLHQTLEEWPNGQRIRAENKFHAKLYSQLYCQKGADDPEILHAMVEANVPADPYWWSPSNQHKQPTAKLVCEKFITEQGNQYQRQLNV